MTLGSTPYFYSLPDSRIAQRPLHPAHDAKLLVVNRASGRIEESTFINLTDFLTPEDLLVFNNTRVIPARLFGSIKGLSTEVEILLVKRII